MYYKPHLLQIKRAVEPQTDEFGRPLESVKQWEMLAYCRCDESDESEVSDARVNEHKKSYHIVIEGHVNVSIGDEVRCLDRKTLEVVAEGRVKKPKRLNYLRFSEIWL